MFLCLVVMGAMQAAVEDIPSQVSDCENGIYAALETFQEHSTALLTDSRRMITTAQNLDRKIKDLDSKLKMKLPVSITGRGFRVRELAIAVTVAFIAGGIFVPILVRQSATYLCNHPPHLCIEKGVGGES